MAYANVIVNGVSAGASYFMVDGSGRYPLTDGRKFKIPNGRHMIQVVEATGSGYRTRFSVTESFESDTAINLIAYTDSVGSNYGNILEVEYNLVTVDSSTADSLEKEVSRQYSSIAQASKKRRRNERIKKAVLTVLIIIAVVVLFKACNS